MFGPRILALALAAVLLGGCVASDGGQQDTPLTPETADAAAVDDNTGGVEGIVTDTEAVPVAGADVALLPGELSGKTAQDGRFSISQVPPGDYQIHVVKLGYTANAKKITVAAGEVTQVVTTIEAIPVAEPRLELFGPFTGYMQCRMATPLSSGACGFIQVVGNTPVTGVWTNDKVLWDFGKFSAENWEGLVFESKWSPSTAATNPKMNQIFSHDKRTGTQWWSDSGGRSSPINFAYTKEDGGPGGQDGGAAAKDKKPDMHHTLRTWITLPFAPATQPVEVAYELRFQMMVTIFYDQAPPEGYTALPDA